MTPRKAASPSKKAAASPSKTKVLNKAEDDSGDPIIQEFPLIFEEDASQLNLLYFPLSVPDSASSIPSFDADSSTVQVKPESRQLQVNYGRRKYWGTAAERLRTQEYVAVVHQDKIHLKPVHRLYTMRPQIAPSAVDAITEEKEEEEATEAKPVTIIKKRETEEQAQARLSSYIYQRKKAEEEPWKVMRLVSKKSLQ